MIKRFHSNLFYASDLDKTAEFYKRLGFDAKKLKDGVRVKLGDFTLAFVDENKTQIQNESGLKPKGLGVFTYVEVDDVDEYFKTIKENGVMPRTEPKDWPWGKREFVVKDPDGYKLVFYTTMKKYRFGFFYLRKMKKRHLYILLRVLFLLIISFVVTSWLFFNIQQATQSTNVFDEKYETSYPPVPLPSFLKDISPIFQIPLSFLRFNVYANNNVTAKTNDGQVTSTSLNIDILRLYTGKIKTGQTKIIRENVSPYNLSGLSYTRSFDVANIATTTLRGDYTVFLKPTRLTFVTTWAIIIVPIVYAFIVILSALLKFILLGFPFVEIWNEFKKRNL